ncbi:MAG: 2-keto-3-deoxy-D-arabino-heptulosonate-7-phosphate synthase I beta [Ignavibacteriae bacterium]|nr:MAG: 2-keto-3-deoxy-D-arabino-heptulosonate-7-phosphate synthase I beta [Ignavibacteriota bacterium]
MIVIMKTDATKSDVEAVKEKICALGFKANEVPGVNRIGIVITGNKSPVNPELFLNMSGVLEAISISKPFKLVSREVKQENTIIKLGNHMIGGKELAIIAGPCSVESREQIIEIGEILSSFGIKFMRGGAYKPRTSPYSFQGLKEEALLYLMEVRERTGMKIVTEVKDVSTLQLVAKAVDVIQIGARNMQNFALLEAAGSIKKPVLLKRGISATIEELLMAAEYIVSNGNYEVILCERGIRTFETYTRNTLDLNAIPIIKRLSHLPIVVDPSHGIGIWDGVASMSMAAIAGGADGLIIEVHQNPESALSDGYQSLKPERFKHLLLKLRKLAEVVDRSLNINLD